MSRDRFNARGYRPVELIDPNEQCTGCTLCALMCPDVVLTVYRRNPQRVRPQEA
jgi:2-oxoglutarate ferredoxin oxidoreductase subunit delta